MGCMQATPTTKNKAKGKAVKSKLNVENLKARYDIDLNELGGGAFGRVFKANDK